MIFVSTSGAPFAEAYKELGQNDRPSAARKLPASTVAASLSGAAVKAWASVPAASAGGIVNDKEIFIGSPIVRHLGHVWSPSKSRSEAT
jgi:hypothetical protein